ncbi:hypothetical protein FRB96_004666 [Tulasnella sp. 330]|nr:hypothetical protein FRB96_004666 [Tulasnella sp. 330]
MFCSVSSWNALVVEERKGANHRVFGDLQLRLRFPKKHQRTLLPSQAVTGLPEVETQPDIPVEIKPRNATIISKIRSLGSKATSALKTTDADSYRRSRNQEMSRSSAMSPPPAVFPSIRRSATKSTVQLIVILHHLGFMPHLEYQYLDIMLILFKLLTICPTPLLEDVTADTTFCALVHRIVLFSPNSQTSLEVDQPISSSPEQGPHLTTDESLLGLETTYQDIQELLRRGLLPKAAGDVYLPYCLNRVSPYPDRPFKTSNGFSLSLSDVNPAPLSSVNADLHEISLPSTLNEQCLSLQTTHGMIRDWIRDQLLPEAARDAYLGHETSLSLSTCDRSSLDTSSDHSLPSSNSMAPVLLTPGNGYLSPTSSAAQSMRPLIALTSVGSRFIEIFDLQAVSVSQPGMRQETLTPRGTQVYFGRQNKEQTIHGFTSHGMISEATEAPRLRYANTPSSPFTHCSSNAPSVHNPRPPIPDSAASSSMEAERVAVPHPSPPVTSLASGLHTLSPRDVIDHAAHRIEDYDTQDDRISSRVRVAPPPKTQAKEDTVFGVINQDDPSKAGVKGHAKPQSSPASERSSFYGSSLDSSLDFELDPTPFFAGSIDFRSPISASGFTPSASPHTPSSSGSLGTQVRSSEAFNDISSPRTPSHTSTRLNQSLTLAQLHSPIRHISSSLAYKKNLTGSSPQSYPASNQSKRTDITTKSKLPRRVASPGEHERSKKRVTGSRIPSFVKHEAGCQKGSGNSNDCVPRFDSVHGREELTLAYHPAEWLAGTRKQRLKGNGTLSITGRHL